MNGYLEESNGNKYLTLVTTDAIHTKKYEELWNKIAYIIRSKTSKSDNYEQKYMKIRSISDDILPVKKTLELNNMIIFVSSVFHEGNKFYWQVFKVECL